MANHGAMLPVPNLHHRPAALQGQRDRLQYHLLDAALACLLFGAAAAVQTVGNPDADPAQVAVGLVTLPLGVCLLSLVPVAGRFPLAAVFAGAAIAKADAVFRHLFTPWN